MKQVISLLKNRFRPFKYSEFRLFFAAQMISLIGNWMQELAKSWIILNLIGKASAIGMVLFATAIPNLLLGSYGGVIADKKSIKPVFMVTQLALATLAFALGIVVSTGHVAIWHLIVFAIMEGTIIAFDMPAFSKITPTLVPKEDFQQAIALNSVSFHLSRVLGPSIAGIIMGMWGTESVFWVNGFSFLCILFVISRLSFVNRFMPTTEVSIQSHSIKEAWRYMWDHTVLWKVIAQLFLLIGLIFPLMFTTFRVFIQNKFHLNAHEFGLVFAVPGIGALLGSTCFLMFSPKNPIKVLPYGLGGLVLFLLCISESPTLDLTLLFMGLFSFAMFLSIASLNVTIQLSIENHIRGRISAIVGMGFVSLAPIMSAPIGFFSDLIGEKYLIWLLAGLFSLASVFLMVYKRAEKVIG